ncbi:pro-neuregulin-4, membrane-bound isoform [Ochotona princeps]|uniref:pro-neuregulin-4, membrane-bound isoform n=1 Tax=Ochotona princeps TaxID=9978 RepID=UPI0027144DC3|nr:pro-neuregulin-4, membrane-bound isoform [Ochotona princeps]
MPTDHEEPCGSNHRSFCLNGGICYVIPTIPSPFCRCIENYTGARCEEVFLPSASIQTKSHLFAALVAVAVLVTLTIGALYCLCRKGPFQRTSTAQYDVSMVETSSPTVRRGNLQESRKEIDGIRENLQITCYDQGLEPQTFEEHLQLST